MPTAGIRTSSTANAAKAVLVALAFIIASSPVIYRDNPEWLPWSLAIVTVGVLFAGNWRMQPTVGLTALVFWVAASAVWTADVAGTSIDVPTLILTVFIGCVIARFGATTVARGLFLGACVAAGSSLLVGALIPRYGRSVEFNGAFVGIYAHRNFLASVAVLGLALTLAFLISAKTRRSRVGYLAAAALFGVTSLATASGSAIVISLLVLLGGAALWVFRRMSPLLIFGTVPILVVMVGGVLIPWAIRSLPELTQLIGRDATLTGRTDIWEFVLTASAERPLTGFGWGGVWRGPLGESIRTAFGYDTVRSAHNGFIDALIQIGWVGALLLTAVLVAALWRSTRLALQTATFAWMPLALLAVTVNSITESQLTRPLGILVIAIVASISWAESRRQSKVRDSVGTAPSSPRPTTQYQGYETQQ